MMSFCVSASPTIFIISLIRTIPPYINGLVSSRALFKSPATTNSLEGLFRKAVVGKRVADRDEALRLFYILVPSSFPLSLSDVSSRDFLIE